MDIGSAHIIGSYLQWREFDLTSTGTDGLVIGANPNRIALIFTAGGTGNVTLSTLASPAMFKGITITSTSVPLILKLADLGGIVQASWYCSTLPSGTSIHVIECYEVEPQ